MYALKSFTLNTNIIRIYSYIYHAVAGHADLGRGHGELLTPSVLATLASYIVIAIGCIAESVVLVY